MPGVRRHERRSSTSCAEPDVERRCLGPTLGTRDWKRERRLGALSKVSVRYMIDDVPAAIAFDTNSLGFTLEHDASPAFASVSRDSVRLLLSGEGSSGKRPLPDGRRQLPGGWNRIHLEVTDLEAEVKRLRAAGVPFRTTEIVSGPGGAQVIIDDPSGNPIELFQPRR